MGMVKAQLDEPTPNLCYLLELLRDAMEGWSESEQRVVTSAVEQFCKNFGCDWPPDVVPEFFTHVGGGEFFPDPYSYEVDPTGAFSDCLDDCDFRKLINTDRHDSLVELVAGKITDTLFDYAKIREEEEAYYKERNHWVLGGVGATISLKDP